MIRERYSISVNDDIIEIHGSLTIRETFDFLNFFEKEGFNEVGIGNENSTIRLFKNGQEKTKNHVLMFSEEDLLLEQSKKEIESLNRRIKELESLVKQLLNDELTSVRNREVILP